LYYSWQTRQSVAAQGEHLHFEIRVTDRELLRRREESLSHSERTWNVVLGCQPVSEGCRSCLAQARLDVHNANAGQAVDWSRRGSGVEIEQALTEPAAWTTPQRVVVAPLADLFQPAVSAIFVQRVLKVVAAHPQHWFLVTTRHPRRMRELLQAQPPPPNLGIGISAEDMAAYAERLPYLFDIRAASRHAVLEPLLGPVDVEHIELPTRDILWPLEGLVQQYLGLDAAHRPQWLPKSDPLRRLPKLDWVVLGGERGQEPRPPHPAWVRQVRDACLRRGVPFFFRGWGDYVPTRKPDLEDSQLMVVSPDGTRPGRGAGSAINRFAVGEQDVWFARLPRGDEPIQFFLDGQRHLGVPPARAAGPRPDGGDSVLERELQRLAPKGTR
jgi:protein gp37